MKVSPIICLFSSGSMVLISWLDLRRVGSLGVAGSSVVAFAKSSAARITTTRKIF